ncbi:organic cation transporter protein [Hyalella azteca]|uniref:Organic cation transporter protein n=1 Tax=Hyalella azteca TaxID=294128 RepID=A0A8B7P0U3_HYAAZ|nr:organic cation transporter protein [Hyalella azteca]
MVVFTMLDLTINWLPSINVMFLFRFLVGLTVPILLGNSFNLCMEICELRYRSVYGILSGLPWALATAAYGVVAYFIRDWRWLQFTLALQCIVYLPAMWFLDESPRWLAVNGHTKRALAILRSAERLNKSTLPSDEHLLSVLVSTHESSVGFGETKKTKIQLLTREISSLFHTAIRARVLIMWFMFIVAMMIYYGLSMAPVSYNVNPFMYMFLTGLMELPAYSLPAPIISRWGRRWPTALSYATSGVALLALAWTPSQIVWLVMTLAMVGKLCISMAFQIVYLFSVELLPTEIRTTGLGSMVFVSRFGAIVTPFITDTLRSLVPWAPSLLFGALSIVAVPLCLRLPETKSKPVPDTIKELAEQKKKWQERDENLLQKR